MARLISFFSFDFDRALVEQIGREIDPNFVRTREYIKQLSEDVCNKIADKLCAELIGP